jgi:hypothetical protein
VTLLEKFDAVDEAGNRYGLEIWQDWFKAGTLANPQRRIPGHKRVTLRNGEHVNPLDDGRFLVVNSSIVLTRID